MAEHDDAYECHARHYLRTLQRHAQAFTQGTEGIEEPLRRLEKNWPQVLAAFSWASAARGSCSAAAEICDALLAAADGDIVQLQLKRRAADVKQLADSVSLAAQRQEQANDAAFLYRFAGVALTQARILELAEETGADVNALVGRLLGQTSAEESSSAEQ